MKKISYFEDNETVTVNPNMKVHPNPFPEKTARVIAFIEKNGLPPTMEQTKKRKKPMRTPLQKELLNLYDFDPTEEEMQALKAFLAQLFADKINPPEKKATEKSA